MNPNAEFDHLQVESIGEVCVARILTESLNTQSTILSVGDELKRLVESRAEQNVLLDFTAVTMVASLMIGQLIVLNKQLTEAGVKLVLCGMHPKVHRVFALTRLTKMFDIKIDQAEGLAAF